MLFLPPDDPVAAAATAAVTAGDHAALRALLADHPSLATAWIGDDPARVPDGKARTLLHVLTDWPGHRPGAAATVRMLADAGADVNAPFVGPHAETPLHWAASADDLAALDALLDAGAAIDAPGAVIGGAPPLADAVAFSNWAAARRLVERGAAVGLHHAAALGMLDVVRSRCAAGPEQDIGERDLALWYAARSGRDAVVEHLLACGADARWIAPWDGGTAADAAARGGHPGLAARLRAAERPTRD